MAKTKKMARAKTKARGKASVAAKRMQVRSPMAAQGLVVKGAKVHGSTSGTFKGNIPIHLPLEENAAARKRTLTRQSGAVVRKQTFVLPDALVVRLKRYCLDHGEQDLSRAAQLALESYLDVGT